MMFTLIDLPYSKEDLAPVISAKTLDFHHGKHLQTYVNNLNNLLKDSSFDGEKLEDIVKKSSGAVFNNAGQILNHNMYFLQLQKAQAGNKPSRKILDLFTRDFGSFEGFKDEFSKKGAGLFGSGWVWLSLNADGKLEISQESNAQNPITRGNVPLLTIDVWEHAYYIDYQNRRAEYIEKFWSIINWDEINNRLA
ncbi:MAG: superoxide dismutase [Bacteroidales bacterium]|nr:superoxide dismutase [Bacteroidales bacterium]